MQFFLNVTSLATVLPYFIAKKACYFHFKEKKKKNSDIRRIKIY